MEDVKKMGFFSRIKTSVTKIEDYYKFIEEKISVAIKYFFLLTLIFTIFLTIIEVHGIMSAVIKANDYVRNQLPDFAYEGGTLSFSQDVEAYDEKYDFYLLSYTTDQASDEQIKSYKDKIKSFGILLLKDKLIYYANGVGAEYDYESLSKQYDLTNLNKQELIQKIDAVGLNGIAVTIFVVLFISLYIANLLIFLMDWLLIAVFAYCAVKICKINMNFKQAFIISIYSLTLSVILSIIYNIVNYLTGFYTPYFRIMYLLISYVYVVAAIFMMKSDLIKQKIEVEKIEKVQEEIHEELKEKNENDKSNDSNSDKKDDKKDSENDDNTIGEPDGSEI